METITLYNLPGCPYCAKVRTRLEELNTAQKLKFNVVDVVRDREDETRIMIAQKSGCSTVPVIHHGDVWIGESGDILEYLEKKFA